MRNMTIRIVGARFPFLVGAALAMTASPSCGGGGGGGSAGSGGGISYPAAPQTCATAVNAGETYGDEDDTPPNLKQTGSGAAFVSAMIREESWDDRSISVRGTISSTDKTTYDLLLYVPAVDLGPACGQSPIHSTNGVVDASWPDVNDGSSQDRAVVFEIRPTGGTCGGSWSLLIEGNKTSVEAP